MFRSIKMFHLIQCLNSLFTGLSVICCFDVFEHWWILNTVLLIVKKRTKWLNCTEQKCSTKIILFQFVWFLSLCIVMSWTVCLCWTAGGTSSQTADDERSNQFCFWCQTIHGSYSARWQTIRKLSSCEGTQHDSCIVLILSDICALQFHHHR